MARKDRVTGGRALKRRVGTRRPRKTLLVFCEGERTEPEYLDALKRQPAVRDVAAVDLRIETGHGGSVPRTLVSTAAAARSKALDEEAEIDEFWCVFDVEWPRNQDQGAWLDNNAARRARRSLDGSSDKGLDAATYMPLAGDAARRAAQLDQRHQRNGTSFPNDNPSCGMHRLLASIEPP
jgi:hypothetical protein